MAGRDDLRRRITYLMLLRVVLITLVLGLTVALNLTSPQELAQPGTLSLFGIIIVTYALSLAYAALLPRVANPMRFADAQIAGDLLITTALVHVTGGAQSAYTFFYPLSIVGAATLRYQRGAALVAAGSVLLFAGVAAAGWLRWLPIPPGQRILPWDLTGSAFLRNVMLNVGAIAGIGVLAAGMGAQLRQSGERLSRQVVQAADLAALNEHIVRSLPGGLITTDLEGQILSINEAAEDILGPPVQGAVGRPLGTVVAALQPFLDGTAAVRRREIGYERGGEKRQLGVSVSLLRDHAGEAMGRIFNFQDLTEFKRAERLALVGAIAAGMAHEIRNPLAAISGSIELLRGGQVGEERALMDIVLREVDRLNGMVTELLDYARPRDPVPMRLDVGAVLAETVRVFAQDRSHPGVQVRYAAPDGEIFAHADPAQIRQVVWNLLRNAAEAMPEGGEVEVALRPREDGWTEISVKDAGVGIPRDEQERVFEPFFTTKARGSGLGLATVHRIVTEHGGTVAVRSETGQGTEVTVRLPAA